MALAPKGAVSTPGPHLEGIHPMRPRTATLALSVFTCPLVVLAVGLVLPAPAGAVNPVSLSDTFSRTATSSWGTPDVGGPYSVSGATSSFSVTGGRGLVRLGSAGVGQEAVQPDLRLTDTDLTTAVATDKAATGWGQSAYLVGRRVAPLTEYRVRTRFAPDGGVWLAVTRTAGTNSEVQIGAEVAAPGLNRLANELVSVHATMLGTSPTTIAARAWRTGTAEPTTWAVTVTDSTTALQAAGAAGVRAYISGSTTNGATTFSFDTLQATAPLPTPSPRPGATAGAAPLGSSTRPVPAGAIVVSPSGNDLALGTWAMPVKTINRALLLALPGATIVLRGGVYHEQVTVLAKRVTIQPAPGETVWMDGSSTVTGWVPDGTVWRKDGWTTRLPRASSTAAQVKPPGVPEAAYPDQVFVNGTAMRQVLTRALVAPGTFYLNEATSQLYLGTNPTGFNVAVSDLQFAIDINLSGGSKVLGIGVRRYGTPLHRKSALFAQSPDVVLEDLVVTQNADTGVSLAAARPTARRLTLSDNGQLGLHGNYADGAVIEDVLVQRNNQAGFANNQAAGGIKLTSSRVITVRRSVIEDNLGPGVWIDQTSYDSTVVRNVSRGNQRSGFQFELSAKAIYAGNVASDNGEWGIYVLESSDAELWNNVLLRNKRAIQVMEGVRSSSIAGSEGFDPRYGLNPAGITWDVDRVNIRNNVFSNARPDSTTMFGVDDSRKLESGQSMGVSSDRNAWHRSVTTAPSWIANWTRWPVKMEVGTTLATFRTVSGQEANSIVADGVAANPYVTDEAGGQYMAPTGSPARTAGAPLPAAVAAALGVPAGTASIGYLA